MVSKSGGICYALDDRELNYVAKQDCYPIPLIHDEAIIQNKAMLTKLDLIRAYHQIRPYQGLPSNYNPFWIV